MINMKGFGDWKVNYRIDESVSLKVCCFCLSKFNNAVIYQTYHCDITCEKLQDDCCEVVVYWFTGTCFDDSSIWIAESFN